MDDREIDRAVAEKFLGWRRSGSWWVNKSGDFQEFVQDFRPSGKPDSCSFVLDEIERREWNWELSYKWNSYLMVIYGWKDPSAELGKMVKVYGNVWNDNRYRAVCEAALQAAETE